MPTDKMSSLYTCKSAFLRLPSKNIVNGLSQDPNRPKPDPELFMKQYRCYVESLSKMGLMVNTYESDERFPDGNFVEDAFLVLDSEVYGKILIELNPGAPSRREEPASLLEFLPKNVVRHTLNKQFTIDGGDILDDRKTLYIGLSQRTQQGAIDELADFVKQFGYRVCPIRVPQGLHLKSGMTCLLPGHFVIQAAFENILKELQHQDPSIQYFVVPTEEEHAANVLPINGKIMIPDSCPQTKAYIAKFYDPEDILEVNTSQARLVDGALTCSCLLM